ncbi:hypothetical protein CcaverHIS002_0510080 [Cutaneotrichosporon cavernicola]|uniref:CASTOR ACT domain-containing protein n=1 Tax=Cutaneotrichosporon cavernicola TaxID=279322 RepID=A0AA48QXI7_9TREE|nr:uncharacterized protein CcaverHIS019_0510640 [Cutaneotrichosporon cavernicola]BEI85607.1 hypothetical protein CcaverHIS002_0510080 [Cutaneotrichosporon cavernicola]BEI93436.1 hypothetical protein CcaverHIS019_0510640 [Cutaneotrichosporon cavernicola]BEJ01214.1 hypothetical protein CcaverHIS631_0510710 [Cutaneotrichosporon cavernicola]
MADVSITALHDPVSIVHVPVGAAAASSTKIYWTLDRAVADESEFCNLTSNRIEIALFAPSDLVEEEWGPCEEPGVAINGPWRVFEVASGDDGGGGGNYDSPHLRHVSAPLAEGGISILYQSSYFTDFLLVKSSDFERASAIFHGKGWNCDPILPPTRRRSVMVSPEMALAASINASVRTDSPADTPPLAEITVLASPLACIGLSADVEASLSARLRKLLVWPERSVLALERARGRKADDAADAFERRNRSKRAGNLNTWNRNKPSQAAEASARALSRPRPFISYTRTEDGTSILTEVRVLRAMLSVAERADIGATELEGSDSEWSDEDQIPTSSSEDGTASRGRSLPSQSGHSLRGRDVTEIPIFWATPPSTPNSARFPGIGSFTPIMRSASGSGAERSSRARLLELERQREREYDLELEEARQFRYARETSLSRLSSSSRSRLGTGHSRTRSDTVSLGVLQHRAIQGALGFMDPRIRRASEGGSREPWAPDPEPAPEDVVEEKSESEEEEEEEDTRASMMRCLQLDLRAVGGAYHLDKSGLVMRFSDQLHRGGVRMLYSSTTHTANILVEGRDVARAERALRPD